MSLRIKRYNPRTIQPGHHTACRETQHGEKRTLKDLLYHAEQRPDYVMAFAPTATSLQMFRSILPEACVFDHFSQSKIESAISCQTELVARGKKRTMLIILDDCMFEKNL